MKKKGIISFIKIKLLFALLLGLILIRVTHSSIVHLVIYWGIVFYTCYLVKFDIVHPYCWFPTSFALYNTAYTVLYTLGYDISAGYSMYNSLYSYIGMAIVLLIVSPLKREKANEQVSNTKINNKANNIFFVTTAVLSIFFAIVLKGRGYTGKGEMQETGDLFYSLGVHLIRWMMVMMVIQLISTKCQNTKINTLYCGISIIAALFMGLCTGERDIIFRVILVIVLTFFYFKRIKKRHILILLPFLFFIMIDSVYFKYYFLRGVGNTSHKEAGNIIYQFLMTDFHATGRNTQFILNSYFTKSYFGIKMFFNELFRGIIPGIDYINPSTWYNYEVYPGSFKGQAFSMVGFGYVIKGIWGIILVFITLGLFIRFVYKYHNKGIYQLAFYIFSISSVIGSYRQTFNTIINISIKAALIVIIYSMICSKIIIKKKTINSNRRKMIT